MFIIRYILLLLKSIRSTYSIGLFANILPGSVLEGHNSIGRFSTFKGSLGLFSYIGKGGVVLGKIGKFTSIASGVHVINGRHPIESPFTSTSPVFYTPYTAVGKGFVKEPTFDEYVYAEDKYPVVIGNDCWIGANASIIEGVRIEDGAVVLSGAIVTKDVPPYAIVGGIPAKIIKYRYSNEIIEKLLALKWWNKDETWLKENACYFSDIETLLKNNI